MDKKMHVQGPQRKYLRVNKKNDMQATAIAGAIKNRTQECWKRARKKARPCRY